MQEEKVPSDVTVFILNIFFSTPSPRAALEAQCGMTRRLNHARSTRKKKSQVPKMFFFFPPTTVDSATQVWKRDSFMFHRCGDLRAALDGTVHQL